MKDSHTYTYLAHEYLQTAGFPFRNLLPIVYYLWQIQKHYFIVALLCIFYLLIFMLRYFIQEHTEPIYMCVWEVRKKNGRPKIRAIEYRRIDVDNLLWIWLVIYRLRAKNIKIRIQNILFCCCFRREMYRHGKKKTKNLFLGIITVIKLDLTRWINLITC